MPRGRPRNPSPEPVESIQTDSEDEGSSGSSFDPTFIVEEVQKKLKFCSHHLAENYFQLNKDLNKELECSICLDKLCCKSCFTLLACGHHFHARCILFVKEKECPLCRDHAH